MIIVEGPDGCGKTTLLEKLRHDLKLNLRPRFADSITGPYPDVFDRVAADFASGVERDHLYDRHPSISEVIYGQVLRGGYDPRFSDPVIDLGLDHEPLIIICAPDYRTALDNVMSSDQMSGVAEKFNQIWEGYSAFVHFYPGNILMWDYEKMDYSTIVRKVEEYLNA